MYFDDHGKKVRTKKEAMNEKGKRPLSIGIYTSVDVWYTIGILFNNA